MVARWGAYLLSFEDEFCLDLFGFLIINTHPFKPEHDHDSQSDLARGRSSETEPNPGQTARRLVRIDHETATPNAIGLISISVAEIAAHT